MSKSDIGSKFVMTWNEAVAHCDTIEQLTPGERNNAKAAFRYLEANFGQSFLPYAHPFSRKLGNRAPWTRKWVVQFVQMIERTSLLPNYTAIRKKLKDPNGYGEGRDLIRLADSLTSLGFDVEFEPTLEKSVPDLGVVRDSDRFFIELSDLRRGHYVRKAEESGLWFMMTAMPHISGIVHSGHIYKQLSSRHMKELAETMKQAAQKARHEETLCEVFVDGTIEFAFAPEEKKGKLESWAKSRRLEVNSISGPPLPSDLVARLRSKIRDKQEQLPRDCPNIIVITSWENLVFLHDVPQIVSEVEEEIYEHSHVALTSFHVGCGSNGESGMFNIGDHLINVTPGWPHFGCSVVFSNRFAEFTFSEGTTKLLLHVLSEM